MLSRILSLFLFLISTSASAYTFTFATEIIEFTDNSKIVAFVNDNEIEKTPTWSPLEETVPPLTITNALKAVQKYAAADPQMANAVLREIELRRIPHHEKYWHYLVKMNTQDEEKPQSRYLIVLMNGKVLPALKESE